MPNPYWADWYVENNYSTEVNKLAWAVHEAAQMYNGNPYPGIPDERFGDESGVPNGMEMLGNGGNTLFVEGYAGGSWDSVRFGNPDSVIYPNYYDHSDMLHK